MDVIFADLAIRPDAIPTQSSAGPAPIGCGADSLRGPQPVNSTKQFHYFIVPNATRLDQYSWPRTGRSEPDLTWARPDPEGPPKEQFDESESYRAGSADPGNSTDGMWRRIFVVPERRCDTGRCKRHRDAQIRVCRDRQLRGPS